MKSGYKRLGDYIKEVNRRNKDLAITNLLGINIDKFFMPSVANVIGTDMSNYKVVENGQFACNRMHVGRDYRLPIALSKNTEDFLVSPAYDVFEILDIDTLDPEYLMMWFSRKEFDRNAWFYTDADVRGGLHWKAFCDMLLPVPDIDVQREIVKEYSVIINRIKLNKQINQKLEETLQALHKQWFVDFEFPNGKGKPYKSGGGEMIWCEKLKQEIPKGWTAGEVGDLGIQRSEGIQTIKSCMGVAYIGLEHMPKESIVLDQWEIVKSIGSNKSTFYKGDILFGKLRPYFHKIGIAFVNGLSSTDIVIITPKEEKFYGYLTMILSSKRFISYATAGSGGTKMPRTSWNYMSKYKIAMPDIKLLDKFNGAFISILKKMENNTFLNRELKQFEELVLKKMSRIESPMLENA